MRRTLARLDRWWQAAGWYVSIGAPLIVGLLGAALHSQALARATWVLVIAGLMVNLGYLVAVVRLIAKQWSTKRARRARTVGRRG